MKPWKRRTIIGIMLFALLIPLVPLVIWSFSWRWDFPSLLPEFSAWAWGEIGSKKIIKAISVSLPVSLSVVAFSLVMSFMPAKMLALEEFRGKSFVEFLLLVPTFIPQISIIFGIQSVFRSIGIYSTLAGVIVAQLVFHVPYMTLLLTSVFKAYAPEYEQQAACLGVNRWKTLVHVTIPSVRPGLMVTCVFSFIGSWGNYLIAAVIGPTKMQTLPVLLFPMMSSGNNSYPLVAAVTILYIAPVLLFLLLSSKVIIGEGFDPRRGRAL